jgi:hypothetical protein
MYACIHTQEALKAISGKFMPIKRWLMYRYTRPSTYVFTHTRINLTYYIYIYIYTHTHTHTYTGSSQGNFRKMYATQAVVDIQIYTPMSVHISTYVHTSYHIYTYIHTHTYTYIYRKLSRRSQENLCQSSSGSCTTQLKFFPSHPCLRMSSMALMVCVCVCIYIYIYIYVCMYMYVCIYIYIYIYVYVCDHVRRN